MFIVQTVLLSSSLFASAASGKKYNAWIDLPIIETIEYFTTIMAQGLIWARKYAGLIGIIGVIWNALKVMTSRMAVKQMLWDTTFKWFGFTALIWLFPALSYGFLGIANDIGENAGMGKALMEQNLKILYSQAKGSLTNNYRELIAEKMTNEIASKTGVKLTNSTISMYDSYASFMNKVNNEIYGTDSSNVPVFSSTRDREMAQSVVDDYVNTLNEDSTFWLSGLALLALNSVCTEKKVDGSDGEDLLDTYVQLQTYLVDKDGNDTMFISPAAMLRLSVFCGIVMWDRWNYEFTKEGDAIGDGITKVGKHIGHFFSMFPQLIELIFCQLVLIVAIVFAMIQYVMTIIEYVIVVSIAAIFLPLMLFDGTKDIPKKFIPVMISFMVKIIVMLICMYFVMYLLTQHTMNIITESWGVNLWAVCEVFFIATLCYVLTQNAPKIAQTILTGQPQLSMGEALAGAGTALATGAAMKQAPHAATMAASKVTNKVGSAAGAVAKNNAAAKAAVGALGENVTGRQKLKASLSARGAVASEGLKERMRARFEAAGQERGTGFSVADKAFQQFGLTKSGGTGGVGGGGSSSAYGQTGQGSTRGHEGEFLNNFSNSSFKNATKTDDKTGQQRHMTGKEFMDEKRKQGETFIAQKLEAENAKKAEKESNEAGKLPENLSGSERAYDK